MHEPTQRCRVKTKKGKKEKEDREKQILEGE